MENQQNIIIYKTQDGKAKLSIGELITSFLFIIYN